MALYAFDGTWNSDRPGSQHDTNVLWFRRAYRKVCFYREGVGTRFGPFGQVIGGIAGAGGRAHVREGMPQLHEPLATGNTESTSSGSAAGRLWRSTSSNHVRPVDGHPTVRFLKTVGMGSFVWHRQPSI